MPDDGFPVACAVRIPAAVIIDHTNDETLLVAENEWKELLLELEDDIQADDNIKQASVTSNKVKVYIEEEAAERYINNVAKIKQYIVDGDVFQVNLSRRWTAPRPDGLTAFDVYQNLSHYLVLLYLV